MTPTHATLTIVYAYDSDWSDRPDWWCKHVRVPAPVLPVIGETIEELHYALDRLWEQGL